MKLPMVVTESSLTSRLNVTGPPSTITRMVPPSADVRESEYVSLATFTLYTGNDAPFDVLAAYVSDKDSIPSALKESEP